VPTEGCSAVPQRVIQRARVLEGQRARLGFRCVASPHKGRFWLRNVRRGLRGCHNRTTPSQPHPKVFEPVFSNDDNQSTLKCPCSRTCCYLLPAYIVRALIRIGKIYPGIDTTEALRPKKRLADEALPAKLILVATLRSVRCPEDCELRTEREAIVLECLKLTHTDRLETYVCTVL
jgi:hypothetical protein